MAAKKDVNRLLHSDISMTHERFIQAMEQRLPDLSFETKERYLAVLSVLVGKLEDPAKNLREILNEMMVEAATHIMQELNS